MPPLVSVIIPCHGQAHFLADAIESALGQDYRSKEIIVIDDGSPDQVEQVARRYPVLLCRLPERGGIGAARNRGLKRCQGDFVVCLDADDRLLPNALAEGVTALSGRSQRGLVFGARRLIDERGRRLPEEPRLVVGKLGYADLLRENLIGPPVGVMFRRSAIAAVGGFATGLQGAEDYDLYLRLAREHECFGHGALLAEYRVHAGSMSANSSAMLKAVQEVFVRQTPWIGRSPELLQAAAAGKRWARVSYDLEQRLTSLSQHTRARRWGSALLAGADLLFRYPRRVLPILVRRLRRALTPRR